MDDNRIKISELREIKKFENVSDEEAELIIDDAVALARMILDCIKDD